MQKHCVRIFCPQFFFFKKYVSFWALSLNNKDHNYLYRTSDKEKCTLRISSRLPFHGLLLLNIWYAENSLVICVRSLICSSWFDEHLTHFYNQRYRKHRVGKWQNYERRYFKISHLWNEERSWSFIRNTFGSPFEYLSLQADMFESCLSVGLA